MLVSDQIHQCLVRQILAWKATNEGEKLRRFAAQFEKINGLEKLNELRSAVKRQWEQGNRGERGVWK